MFDSPLSLLNAEDTSSALSPSQRMRIAYLLTMVGGFLDAYTYFERGGVFANAQTGNIVKLGIALSNGARDAYLAYLMPICARALRACEQAGDQAMLDVVVAAYALKVLAVKKYSEGCNGVESQYIADIDVSECPRL